METDSATLAAAFEVSKRRIEQMAREGIVVRVGRGRYDLVASVRGYLAHALAGQSSANEPADITEARRALLIQQERRERRLNEEALGNLVLVDHVRQIWTAAESALAAQLEGSPGRIAADVAGESDPAIIRHTLLDENRRIRRAYAAAIERIFEGSPK